MGAGLIRGGIRMDARRAEAAEAGAKELLRVLRQAIGRGFDWEAEPEKNKALWREAAAACITAAANVWVEGPKQ